MESYDATEDVAPLRLGKEAPDHQSLDSFGWDWNPAACLRHEKALLKDDELHPGSSFSVEASTDTADSTYGSMKISPMTSKHRVCSPSDGRYPHYCLDRKRKF